MAEPTDERRDARRDRRKLRPLSGARLERIALHHLDRYPSSRAGLRRVLERRVRRHLDALGGDPDEHAGWIDAVIERLAERGLLDDRAYADALARRLRRRGGSRRRIEVRLREKGVGPEIASEVLASHGDAEIELTAARTHARRRRLGPHRADAAARREHRERDLAAMARAGFDYGTARAVIEEDEGEDAATASFFEA